MVVFSCAGTLDSSRCFFHPPLHVEVSNPPGFCCPCTIPILFLYASWITHLLKNPYTAVAGQTFVPSPHMSKTLKITRHSEGKVQYVLSWGPHFLKVCSSAAYTCARVFLAFDTGLYAQTFYTHH